MKKSLSFILALTMISSCLALAGCNNEEQLGYFKEQRIKKDYISHFDISDVTANDVVLDYYGGNYNGYEIVMLDAECHDPETRVEQIGDSSITYYDSNQLYAWKNGIFYSLVDLYASNDFSVDDIKFIISRYSERISQFADISDEYDFNSKEEVLSIFELLTSFDYDSIQFDHLVVIVDPKLSLKDARLQKEFFGEDLVKNISKIEKIYGYDDCHGYSIVLYQRNLFHMTYAIERIKKIPGVINIFPWISSGYTAIPSDPSYALDQQWGLDNISIEKVWNFSTGASNFVVGVVDSGISSHPDLVENLIQGKDFYNDSDFANDDAKNHGTHIAGIIGAVGNNSIGISGINWQISLIPLQNITAIDNAGYKPLYNYRPDTNSTTEAVCYAINSYNTDNPIKILNMSFILEDGTDDLEYYIQEYEGLIVCSAGNSGDDLDELVVFPQHYTSSNIIVVGAIDENNERWVQDSTNSSSYGLSTVDIYAPGDNIYSTINDGTYGNMSGTSMAAPFVTGVAALLWSINPNLSALEVKECILNGAEIIEIEVEPGFLGIGREKQTVKKLNAWGSFMYMMQNYTPEIVASQGVSQHSFVTNEAEAYYAQIIIPFTEEFTFTLSGVGSSVDITLYDSEMNEIPITKTWQGNQWTVQFTKELTPGTYYVAGSYDNTTGGTTLNLSVSHEHTYSDWVSISETRHKECCECGVTGTTTGAHVTKASSIVNGKSYCIYCGYLVTLTEGFIPIIHNVQKVSINGSYILPNGIIVLVDEDVEAYLNGTLVFYDKDKVPELQ